MLDKYVAKKNQKDLKDEWLNTVERLVTRTIED